ncbi:MAG: Transposase, family [Myxococcaceae bacterium]|nr:Transposase, family [Myxococcaceae bacterium]
MRAIDIVRRLCAPCLQQVHATRFKAVMRGLEAMLLAQRLSVTSVGRAVRGKHLARHGIKMMDRLVGNPRLFRERRIWFGELARILIGAQRRVVVLVDWTQLHGDAWALVAAVPYLGRAVPVFSESHDKSRGGMTSVEEEFLKTLRTLLPPHCQPVIVADGGFRSPFIRACQNLGLEFVIRLRNEQGVALFGADERRTFTALFDSAADSDQCLGEARPYATSSEVGTWRLVLSRRPRQAANRRRYVDDYERRRACEPWLLATNLQNDAATTVVAVYAKRMQIEEYFRDTKNSRFGWCLEHARASSKQRYDVLLLLAALAFTAVVLVGAAAEAEKLEKRFRASSLKQRVLSVFTLGSLVLRSRELARLRLATVWKEMKRLRFLNRDLFPKLRAPRSENRNVSLPLPHDLFCVDCGWNGSRFGWPP